MHALRRALRIRRGFRVEHAYYKETSPVRLGRALAPRGPGEKEFRVTFPDREKLLIHATEHRHFADLTGPRLLPAYRAIDHLVRPGMRILNPRCGTGYGPAELSRMVGPSGGVVALEPDDESAHYAAKRYTGPDLAPNLAIEHADAEALEWEADGAFDGAVLITDLGPDEGLGSMVRESWRVIAPGGFLVLALGAPVDEHVDLARSLCPEAFGAPGTQIEPLDTDAGAPVGIVIRRGETPARGAEPEPPRATDDG